MEVVVDPTGKSARWHALNSGSSGGLWVCKLSRNIWGTPLDACLRHRAVQAIPSGSRSPSTKSSGGSSGGPPPKGFGQFRAVSGSGFGQFWASTQIPDLKRNPFAPKSFGQFRAVSGSLGKHFRAFLGSTLGLSWGAVSGTPGEGFWAFVESNSRQF